MRQLRLAFQRSRSLQKFDRARGTEIFLSSDTNKLYVWTREINDLAALKAVMKRELLDILEHSRETGVASETEVAEAIKPYVLMVVGVNGVGKTTTIGKLAQRIKDEGNDVLICAADTFRAAASDQLEIWAARAGVPIVQQKQGTDPAAVLFDALQSAKAKNADVLIVDTAGRLHNKANLMAELEKMKRIAGREVSQAPHETLLVIDAVTGQITMVVNDDGNGGQTTVECNPDNNEDSVVIEQCVVK